ncbi:MAG: 7TM domain-containing protein, partial [bacterium]|nr:7TM domain-containing protein [bacterium]
YPKSIQSYLQPPAVSERLEKSLEQLEQELDLSAKDNIQKAKALFYFIHEEIFISDETIGLENTLLYSRGTHFSRVNLLTLLLRRQGIPSRTVVGIKLLDKKDKKRPWVYWNEAYLDGKWIPLFPVKGYFAEIPANYIPLVRPVHLEEKVKIEGFRFGIYAHRVVADRFSALEYSQELAKKDSAFLGFSPYTLPLSEQPALKLLLLFSLGCVVLAFCRNILGIKTFGIFFPILLALFFKNTSLLFGLGFFLMLLLMGYGERFWLSKLQLLAVPRFSIILTLIVITLLVFSVLNRRYQFSDYSVTLLPIIIVTMFIERFSIMLEEEGWSNTGKSLVGTLVIALISYGLFLWKDLEILIYTHPELLFTVIAILILIGKYTGYRLSELIRFREFIKRQKNYDVS